MRSTKTKIPKVLSDLKKSRISMTRIMNAQPCGRYTRGVVLGLFAGRKIVTAKDILAMHIPAADKLWGCLMMMSKVQIDKLTGLVGAKPEVCYNRWGRLWFKLCRCESRNYVVRWVTKPEGREALRILRSLVG